MNTNIRKAREEAGFSQKQVALTLCVSAPTVSDWESGKTYPTAANLKALVNLYNESSDYLLGLTDKRDFDETASRQICEAISAEMKARPELFSNFFIPADVKESIENGTYTFNNVNFAQFADKLSRPLSDFFPKEGSQSEEDLKAAFWGGEKDLSSKELDEMWEDVKEYARYKAEQRRKKKEE